MTLRHGSFIKGLANSPQEFSNRREEFKLFFNLAEKKAVDRFKDMYQSIRIR
jgi:hypothetical protein